MGVLSDLLLVRKLPPVHAKPSERKQPGDLKRDPDHYLDDHADLL